jgi:hypothetical protein
MGLKDNEVATLLIQEHSFLKGEIATLTNHYKGHVQYTQIGITAAIALFALISQSGQSFLQPGAGTVTFLMYAITFFVGYAAFTVLETQYLINTLGAYLSVQEDKINLLAKKDVVFWETTLCPYLFDLTSLKGNRLRYPGTYLFIFQWLMMVIMLIPLSLLSFFDQSKYQPNRIYILLFWFNVAVAALTLLAIFLVTRDVLGKGNLWKRTRARAIELSYKGFTIDMVETKSAISEET